jgi:hypothetical protein
MRLSPIAEKWPIKLYLHHPQENFCLKTPFNMQA